MKSKSLSGIKKATYFVVVMFGAFGVSLAVLYFLDLVPTGIRQEISNSYILPINANPLIKDATTVATTTIISSPQKFTVPDRVVIEKIKVNTKVLIPSSINVATLDADLQKGAVYYPGSGTIEQGNIFIFGHSTNWPVVQNQAYKTFNDLDKLKAGDIITIYSGSLKYSYAVQTVTLLDAENALVEFDNSGQNLTLSTCNTFGQKQERWVVKAKRV